MRRNKPVAQLKGIDQPDEDKNAAGMIDRIRKLRRSLDVSPEDIIGWIRKGRL